MSKPITERSFVLALSYGIGLMRDDLLNESLLFGLDHASSAIAGWANDYNNFRPHSSLGYQTPANYAGIFTTNGSETAQYENFVFPPVAHIRPFGISKPPRL